MKKNKLAVLTSCLVLSGTFCTQAQNKTPQEIRIPDTYKLTNKSIYRNGWIDFNKNGKKDVYEDPTVPIDARVEDLLSQMNVEEKTCQMVTLYGYKRVLKDDLPTSDWKKQLWKDGIGAIDEHLNGFQQWGLPPSDNPYVWPASRHAWALNEVQRFFIEETRLGIPTDFTNEGIRGVESLSPPTSRHSWDWDTPGTGTWFIRSAISPGAKDGCWDIPMSMLRSSMSGAINVGDAMKRYTAKAHIW